MPDLIYTIAIWLILLGLAGLGWSLYWASLYEHFRLIREGKEMQRKDDRTRRHTARRGVYDQEA